MTLVRVLSRWKIMLGDLGLAELLRWAPEYLAELVRHMRDDFDRRHGTDTNRSVPVEELRGVGDHQQNAELYWPVREASFRSMLGAVDIPLDGFTFIDLGCGKGRGLLLAASWPFRRLVGVESSPSLCEVAEANLRRFGTAYSMMPPAEVQCQDAASYIFPSGPLLVFLFDPFGPPVLEPVVARLAESLRTEPRECRIAYRFPTHRHVFERAGFTPVTEQRRNWCLTYPWVVLRGPNS